jgi:hypothetical protein
MVPGPAMFASMARQLTVDESAYATGGTFALSVVLWPDGHRALAKTRSAALAIEQDGDVEVMNLA